MPPGFSAWSERDRLSPPSGSKATSTPSPTAARNAAREASASSGVPPRPRIRSCFVRDIGAEGGDSGVARQLQHRRAGAAPPAPVDQEGLARAHLRHAG